MLTVPPGTTRQKLPRAPGAVGLMDATSNAGREGVVLEVKEGPQWFVAKLDFEVSRGGRLLPRQRGII